MKLKKFNLHWEATISGVQTVEAFDEEDAQEQFDSMITADMLEDNPICASLEEVELAPKTKKAKAKK